MNSDRHRASIDVDDLSFAYNGTQVLHDVTFHVASGEMVAIIGPNGAGKTTLMACVNGILREHTGRICIGNADLRFMKAREVARHIAVVPQEFQVPFAYRVREVVALGRSPYLGRFGTLHESDEHAIDRALAVTDVEELQGREYNALSGGERQRVVIALALAQDPRVLLLDEPTVHLDLSHRIDLLRLVAKINAGRGVTVLAAMHDIDLVAGFFPRVIVLGNGRVVADGPAGDVITSSMLQRVFDVEAQVIEDPDTGLSRVFPKLDPPAERV